MTFELPRERQYLISDFSSMEKAIAPLDSNIKPLGEYLKEISETVKLDQVQPSLK